MIKEAEKLSTQFMIVRTVGFISEIPEDVQAKIMSFALKRISPKTNFVVLDPECRENCLEDEGRTLRTVNLWIKKKVYAVLDDYGDPEGWDQIYEPETADELRKAPNCRYVITFMLASEY